MVIVNHRTGDPEEVGIRGKFSEIKGQRPKAGGPRRILGSNYLSSEKYPSKAAHFRMVRNPARRSPVLSTGFINRKLQIPTKNAKSVERRAQNEHCHKLKRSLSASRSSPCNSGGLYGIGIFLQKSAKVQD